MTNDAERVSDKLLRWNFAEDTMEPANDGTYVYFDEAADIIEAQSKALAEAGAGHEAALSDERLRTFANSLSSGEWTSALCAAYNPTADDAVTYDQAKAALIADIRARRSEPVTDLRLSMWAEVVEDDVTGTTIWRCSVYADSGESDDLDTIQLLASAFPMGTRLRILEPKS